MFRDGNLRCVETLLAPYKKAERSFDATIDKSYADPYDDADLHLADPSHRYHNSYLKYIGNGKFGLVAEGLGGGRSRSFHIQGRRALDLPLPYYPLVDVDYFGAPSQSKYQPLTRSPSMIHGP